MINNKKTAMENTKIKYISDEKGEIVEVIIPIELWRDLASEKETAYLLASKTMRNRLLEAKNRQTGISLEEVCEKLGI
jgi:PHD/YefM family antitoxin component YafN of YafNO toxin-antitoxin module